MRNSFQQIDSVAAPNWKKNAFDLSHWKRMSANIAEAIPTLIIDAVPGDSFRINQEILTRFSPLASPVYENFQLFTHFFKVPHQMLMRRDANQGYGGWEDFINGDPDGYYTYNTLPRITINNTNKIYFYQGQLADYLNYPVTSSGVTIHANAEEEINILRALAYHLIYDEYYRDQNLQNCLGEKMGGDPDDPYKGYDWTTYGGGTAAQYVFPSRPLPVCWEKDYFTSALPYAHDPNNISVEYDLDLTTDYTGVTHGTSIRDTSGNMLAGSPTGLDSDASGYLELSGGAWAVVDLGNQSKATLEIMELRRTEALFRWYEAQNRGGHRYEEYMFTVYGVKVQRPKDVPIYLGGSVENIKVSEVLSTTETLDNAAAGSESITQPLGGFGGRSVTYGKTKDINVYCDEFSIIMGISFIRMRSTIGWQGIEKQISKLDREDFFIPHLQGIGDQAIQNRELFWDQADSTSGLSADTFGYSPRYSEYKFGLNTIHGDMRDSLDFWHCARTFTDTPSLNSTFIQMSYSSTDFHRIFINTTTSDDKLWLFIHNYVRAIRPMRKYDYGQ